MWSHDFMGDSPPCPLHPCKRYSPPKDIVDQVRQAMQRDKEDFEMALDTKKYTSEVHATSNQSAIKDTVSSLNTSSDIQTDPDLNSNISFASSFALAARGAQLAMEAAEKEAIKQGWNVTIAVVDAGGHLMALKRMDGAMPVASMVAYNKA